MSVDRSHMPPEQGKMPIQWSSIGFRLAFLLQFMFCVQLYFNQLSLVSKLDSLHLPSETLSRIKRDVQSFSEEYSAELEAEFEANVYNATEASTASTTTTTTTTTSTSTVRNEVTGRRHHRKSQRLPVERFMVSTESTTSAPIMVRASRTKSTSRKKSKSRQDKNTHYEVEDVGHRRTYNAAGSGELLALSRPPSAVLPAVLPFSPAAIHYVGDISNITKARHEHYTGNGRIRISGIYSDWAPANWANLLPASQHFSMTHGKVSVLRGGLYLLYAQIHYANTQELNCYRALHNDVTIAQCCSTTSHPDRHEVKANTCSLLTTVYLVPGDQVWLADVHERFVILTKEKSYFGMVQLVPPPK